MDKKIAIIGAGMDPMSVAAIAATLPPNIQIATIDQVKDMHKRTSEEQEAYNAVMNSQADKMTALKGQSNEMHLRHFDKSGEVHFRSTKSRKGNNSKRPKPRKKKK